MSRYLGYLIKGWGQVPENVKLFHDLVNHQHRIWCFFLVSHFPAFRLAPGSQLSMRIAPIIIESPCPANCNWYEALQATIEWDRRHRL